MEKTIVWMVVGCMKVILLLVSTCCLLVAHHEKETRMQLESKSIVATVGRELQYFINRTIHEGKYVLPFH